MKSYLPLALASALFLLPLATDASQVTKSIGGGDWFVDASSCLADQTSYLQSTYTDKGQQVVQDQMQCSCTQTVGRQVTQGQCTDFPYQIPNSGSRFWWEGIYTITSGSSVTGSNQQDSSFQNSNSPSDSSHSPDAPGPTFGGSNSPSPQAQGQPIIDNPLQVGNLGDLLLAILHFITRTVGPIIVILMLVYVGVLFATSSFRPDNIQRAREALLYTLIGALILLGAEAIAIGIQQTVQAFAGG